jgi:hypothetical protein
MHYSAWKLTLLGVLAGLVVAAPASAARTVTVSPTAPASWTSDPGNGLNTGFGTDPGVGPAALRGKCGTSTQDYCDFTLVHFTGAPLTGGTATFRIDGFQPYSDFDLRVYASDASGEQFEDLSDPTGDVTKDSPLGEDDPRATGAGDFETTQLDLTGYVDANREAYFLVVVPYFLVANDTYTGRVTLTP